VISLGNLRDFRHFAGDLPTAHRLLEIRCSIRTELRGRVRPHWSRGGSRGQGSQRAAARCFALAEDTASAKQQATSFLPWRTQTMSHYFTRRRFLQTSAALAAAAGPLAAEEEKPSANEKLHLGVIGVGGQGSYNLAHVAHENIVALCD